MEERCKRQREPCRQKNQRKKTGQQSSGLEKKSTWKIQYCSYIAICTMGKKPPALFILFLFVFYFLDVADED